MMILAKTLNRPKKVLSHIQREATSLLSLVTQKTSLKSLLLRKKLMTTLNTLTKTMIEMTTEVTENTIAKTKKTGLVAQTSPVIVAIDLRVSAIATMTMITMSQNGLMRRKRIDYRPAVMMTGP